MAMIDKGKQPKGGPVEKPLGKGGGKKAKENPVKGAKSMKGTGYSGPHSGASYSGDNPVK